MTSARRRGRKARTHSPKRESSGESFIYDGPLFVGTVNERRGVLTAKTPSGETVGEFREIRVAMRALTTAAKARGQ